MTVRSGLLVAGAASAVIALTVPVALTTAGSAQAVNVVSPEVGSDRRVTFRLSAPTASRVEVVGLAPSPSLASQTNAAPLTMVREHDIWTATSAPLTPDIYSYRFSVDGTVINDPANRAVIEAFPVSTSKVAVPGVPGTDPGAPRGTVTRETYASAAIGADEEYLAYTPPGYDAGRTAPYPVLYLLHGLGDLAASWVTNGGIDLTLNNLIFTARATPMVVVMPRSSGTNRISMNAPAFERALLDELIPRVEREFHVSREASGRALAGVSVGGAQALSIGLRHTDVFRSVGLFSCAFDNMNSTPGIPDPRALPLDLAPLRLVFLGEGTAEPGILEDSRALVQTLQAKGIRVVALEVNGQGHVWPVWRQVFAGFAQEVFRP